MESTPQIQDDSDPTESEHPSQRTALIGGLVSALLSGLLWGLAHGTTTSVVLPWVSLVPWLAWISLRAQTPGGRLLVLGCSWLAGLVTWLVSIPWIAHTLSNFGEMPAAVALALLSLLCLYLGTYHLAAGGLFFWLCRRTRPALVVVGTAAFWVVLEWIRAWMISGFPWNLAAYSAVDVPGVLELSSWIGAYGTSAIVVGVNACLAILVTGRGVRIPLVGVASAVLLLGLAAVFARWEETPSSRSDANAVRIVQPNVSIFDEPTAAEIQEGYGRLLQLSRCPQPGTLIVWPESAAWPYSWERDRGLRRDISELLAAGCWLLINSTSSEHADNDTRFYNSALLLDPTGGVQRYDKNHLVPFGEYVPFAELLPIEQLARNVGSYTRGDEPTILNFGASGIEASTAAEAPSDDRSLALGVSICFEIVFPGEVAERVRRGAEVLVTITNDAWYGDSSAPRQHLRAARFRAAELRRPVVRAAITGISAMIDPGGQVVDTVDLGRAGAIDAEVRAGVSRTLYSRWPGAVPLVCWLLSVGVLTASGFASRFTSADADRGKLRPQDGGDS